MSPAASLLTALLMATFTAASPVEVRSSSATTLSFTKRINSNAGVASLVQQEQTRAATLKARGDALHSGSLVHRQSPSTNLTAYKPFSPYILSAGVGSPPTNYELILELTTANTWVGADKAWKPTITSKDTGQSVGLYVGSEFFSGEEWLDNFDLGSGLVVTKQSIGVASESFGYDLGVDGAIGLAPAYLTIGTLFNQPNVAFPTVADNLYNQATIPEEVVSLYLAPGVDGKNTTGELTFGGVDSSKYTGQINYVPITATKPSSYFWGIDQSITYGGKTILKQNAGVVEASSPFILIASDAYDAYKIATGATEDSATNMLKLSASQYETLENLDFIIGSITYTLTPNGQIFPRALNTYIGGSASAVYLMVADIGRPSGSGLDFVIGQPFFERFYSVFDTERLRIGFATTIHTNSITN